ncbi:unnamed protein product [Spirodela intermedia]|uniref:Uncharacterized protein n=1 Tax=Spirodela intermedia TaxID=51605 RepID=A0ABN7EA53_SPIIN|nr:unnamed protein product [Spirodela intermedia]
MVFNQFQLGELKETLIVLQLVDSLVKTPQSLLEDVIIDISLLKMIYVMHTIILGRPFLATAKVNKTAKIK